MRKVCVVLGSRANYGSIKSAMRAGVRKQHDNLTVLQCTTEYPCPPEHVGLNVMLEMREHYGLPVGFSDHTLSNAAALAAVTLGASVVEKHFTLSKLMYGSDARHSAEPAQFAELMQHIREIEDMLSNPVDKSDVSPYEDMKDIFQKSLVSVVDIPAGTTITGDMLGVKKPGTGIAPRRIAEVVGSRAARDIAADTVLTEQDVLIAEAARA